MPFRLRALSVTLMLAAVATAPGRVSAQGSPVRGPLRDSLVEGRRIRVTLPGRPLALGSPRVEGEFRSMDADSLRFTLGGRDTAFALSEVRRLDVRVHHGDRGRNVRYGAAGGALVGAIGLYFVTGLLDECSHSGDEMEVFCVEDRNRARIVSAAVGAVVWSGIGALGGALVPTRRWQRVPHEASRVGVVAAPRGVGLAVSF